MPKLERYNQFDGLHWETGTVRNFYDYCGVKAPHTGRPYSEALFLGVSGGAVMGYFSFAYEGYDPHVALLTRNTFDPFETMLQRLGVIQHNRQTTNPEKGKRNLLETLEEGVPAIAWADMFSLPYNGEPFDEGVWAMMPILVYGYEEETSTAWIADRARVPLTITTAELDAARARVKKVKSRILTLEPPDAGKLPAAVQQGIWGCIKLYLEAPPKGTRNNFGLTAFQYWADLLVKPRQRLSWEKVFPAGQKMIAGLLTAFHGICIMGKSEHGRADRDLYADFLDEASMILSKPALQEVAQQFRVCASAWGELAQALLPDSVPAFKEMRQLVLEHHRLFLQQGCEALVEAQTLKDRLEEVKAAAIADFPLNDAEVVAFRENLRDYVLKVHDVEREAVLALQAAMA